MRFVTTSEITEINIAVRIVSMWHSLPLLKAGLVGHTFLQTPTVFDIISEQDIALV